MGRRLIETPMTWSLSSESLKRGRPIFNFSHHVFEYVHFFEGTNEIGRHAERGERERERERAEWMGAVRFEFPT